MALPSGKTIEVVYFDAGRRRPRRSRRSGAAHLPRLRLAASSTRSSGARSTALSWEVTLRCPNCEWLDTGVFDQDTVERFDEELDRGTDNLVDDLKRLIQANMEEEIERFSNALASDHILPEDF